MLSTDGTEVTGSGHQHINNTGGDFPRKLPAECDAVLYCML